MGKKYLDTKGGTLESSILEVWKQAAAVTETNKNDKSDDGEGLDAVQKDAVKKKFKDRKDKDIDNDGDTDSSDEYLHKKRKAISKKVDEDADLEESPFSGKSKEIDKMKFPTKGVKTVHPKKSKKGKKEENELDEYITKEGTRKKVNGGDGRMPKKEDVDLTANAEEYTTTSYFTVQSMRERLHQVWGEAHVPGHDEDEDEDPVGKKPKGKKSTETGKKAAKVEIDPEITEKKKSIRAMYGKY